MLIKNKSNSQFLLVEPIAKTPYPPLGLLKISTMLKRRYKNCTVFTQVGNSIPNGLINPKKIYITSLFTWDIDKVISSVAFYQRQFPKSEIMVGGISASLIPKEIFSKTGIMPHVGLLQDAESCTPDYSLSFGRTIASSITFASRGCIRNCKFCHVNTLEPEFFVKDNWQKDIAPELPAITFLDNNWLASPNFEKDCNKLIKLGKRLDFNQGLDARLYDEEKAKLLSKLNIDPIRFAFDDVSYEKFVVRAVQLAKKYSKKEIRVYVLYNFKDTPEDFFYRINFLNKAGVLSFPMEYRRTNEGKTKMPGPHWNTALLRALKLSLMFYYRKGMITESKKSFKSIYGNNHKQFVRKLYEIYSYDKTLRRKEKETLHVKK